jgi:endonuclease/exonuclease/phosphatase (EEP) superfamily protein YafD
MRTVLRRLFQVIVAVYALAVLAWAVAHPIFGDRPWWLFVINAFSVYLFAPLPMFLLMALALRRRLLLGALGLVMMAGLYWHGALLIPKFSSAPNAAPRLRVMTFNTLFVSQNANKTLIAIREANADVVSLQELNPIIANALQTELAQIYPHQLLRPAWNSSGLGFISRYPITELKPNDFNDAAWGDVPLFISLNFNDKAITLVNAHPAATAPGEPEWMDVTIRSRNAQVTSLANYAKTRAEPIIVPIDMNATPSNEPYRAMSTVLVDSWREAGWGLGHTFPGAATPGGSRPTRRGRPIVPMWLVRIDYVWHSQHFVAVEATTGPFDEQSDHRPLVVTLALVAQ